MQGSQHDPSPTPPQVKGPHQLVYQPLHPNYSPPKTKELLQQGDLNITQIAFEVGCQNQAYYSRAFREEFGVALKKVASKC